MVNGSNSSLCFLIKSSKSLTISNAMVVLIDMITEGKDPQKILNKLNEINERIKELKNLSN